VTNAPKGGQVKVTVKFTSTAGVGEKSWTQPTDQDPVNHLKGNFSGEIIRETLKGPSIESWNGGATLDRSGPLVLGGATGSYNLASGSITYHLSGQEGLGVTGCKWSGTRVVSLPAGPSSGSAGVFGAPPTFSDPPYSYSISISTPPLEEITYSRNSCPEAAQKEGWEGKEETIPFGVSFNTGEQESPDGIEYSGSTEESAGVTIKQSWAFKGEP
jgi:hypothetical protein